MKTAIIADIHGNHPALEAVMEKITALDIDRIICAGDIIGYGASPNEVTDIVRESAYVSIRGNHEDALFDPAESASFNSHAKHVIDWTLDALTAENLIYLKRLEHTARVGDITMAHGSLLDPDEYVSTPFHAARSLDIAKTKITVVGHTHQSEVYRFNLETEMCVDILRLEGKVELDEKYRYMINPGSVGQPRDGDTRASFAVYDDDGDGSVEIFRVIYDIDLAAKKIIESGFPEMLAERLYEGR